MRVLRNAILAICALLLAVTAAATVADPAAWPAVLVLAALLAAILFERQRYADRVGASPRAPLTPTAERFIDPESGKPVQVWANARGERHYVEEPPAGG